MSTAVKSRIPSLNASKYPSRVSSSRQPEALLKSPLRHSDTKAGPPAWQNNQTLLTRRQRNKYQAVDGSTSDKTCRQASPSRERARQRATQTAPQNSEAPAWLRFLIAVQRGSTPITFILVVGVLIVYGWSVYSQRAWSRAYRQLAQLQREERQLTAASEVRKYELAQQAESATAGLVRRDPANVIFLKPEPPRSLLSPNSNRPTKGPAPVSPVSY